LQRIEQLVCDVNSGEKELKKKKEKLAKAQEKIDKIKSGNWQVLSEIDNKNREQ